MGRANVIVLFFRHVTRTGRCSALLVPHFTSFKTTHCFFLRFGCGVVVKSCSLRSSVAYAQPVTTRCPPPPDHSLPRFSFFHETPYEPTIYIHTPHITSQHTRYRKVTLVGEDFIQWYVHSFYCFISTFGMVWLGDSLRGLYYWVLVSLAPWLALSPAKTFPSTQFNAIRTYAHTHFPLFALAFLQLTRSHFLFSVAH